MRLMEWLSGVLTGTLGLAALMGIVAAVLAALATQLSRDDAPALG